MLTSHRTSRYNVAPRSHAPVIRRRQAGDIAPGSSHPGDSEGVEDVVMHTMKWGLVPHWNKHDDGNLNTINARGEALVEGGGMWGSIKGKKRCAIPCQGYYEWLKKGRERLPHLTKRKDGNLVLLAGLYDCVTLEGLCNCGTVSALKPQLENQVKTSHCGRSPSSQLMPTKSLVGFTTGSR